MESIWLFFENQRCSLAEEVTLANWQSTKGLKMYKQARLAPMESIWLFTESQRQ